MHKGLDTHVVTAYEPAQNRPLSHTWHVNAQSFTTRKKFSYLFHKFYNVLV